MKKQTEIPLYLRLCPCSKVLSFVVVLATKNLSNIIVSSGTWYYLRGSTYKVSSSEFEEELRIVLEYKPGKTGNQKSYCNV